MLRLLLAATLAFVSPAAAQIAINSTPVTGGSSTPQQYGVLFNKNGRVGDAAIDTGLSNGITGPFIVINGNAAPLNNIATILGGGISPVFGLGCADEGECIHSIQSTGLNSNGTLFFYKARGTGANPLPVKGPNMSNNFLGDLLGVIGAGGHQIAGRGGSSVGSGYIEFRACEDFDATHTGTRLSFMLQRGGTAYPADAIELFSTQCDGSIAMPTAVSTTVNQNADTLHIITNGNSGINATAGALATNGPNAAFFGIAGTGYTAMPIMQNSAFFNSSPGANGIVINARGANKPITLANGDIESGHIVGGVVTVTNGYAVGALVGVSCSGPPTANYTSVGGIVTHC